MFIIRLFFCLCVCECCLFICLYFIAYNMANYSSKACWSVDTWLHFNAHRYFVSLSFIDSFFYLSFISFSVWSSSSFICSSRVLILSLLTLHIAHSEWVSVRACLLCIFLCFWKIKRISARFAHLHIILFFSFSSFHTTISHFVRACVFVYLRDAEH